MIRKAGRITVLLVAVLAIAAVMSCGKDSDTSDRAASALNSSPTPGPSAIASSNSSPTPEPLTNAELLAKVQEVYGGVFSYEVTYTSSATSPEETTNRTSLVQFGGPAQFHVRTTTDDQAHEVIGINRTYYTRHNTDGTSLPETWSKSEGGQYGSDWDRIKGFFSDLDVPTEVEYSDDTTTLRGVTAPPRRMIGGPPGANIEFFNGPYTLIVDRFTYAPIEGEYESTVVGTFTDLSSGAKTTTRTEVVETLNFSVFDEPVLVEPPPAEITVDFIGPTSTPAVKR